MAGQWDFGNGHPGQQDGEVCGPGDRPSQAIFGGGQPPSTVMLRGAYHPAVAEALATQRAARPAPYRRSVTMIRADTELTTNARPYLIYLRLAEILLDISKIQYILSTIQ